MLNIVVLVSGSGSNLQSIIDNLAAKNNPFVKIQSVIADRECYALERAKVANVTGFVVDRKVEKTNLSAKIDSLISDGCDLIVLAGFLSILDGKFIQKWQNKIINIHPSLLPKFGGSGMWGMNVHKAVIAAGETSSGCTVHFVTEEIDSGKVILQSVVDVLATDTPEDLQKRVQSVESDTLINAIKLFGEQHKCI